MAAKALMLARRTFRPCPRDLTQSNLRARLRQQELPSSNALRRVGETGTRARRSHGLSDFETDLKSATRWLCREGFDDAATALAAGAMVAGPKGRTWGRGRGHVWPTGTKKGYDKGHYHILSGRHD